MHSADIVYRGKTGGSAEFVKLDARMINAHDQKVGAGAMGALFPMYQDQLAAGGFFRVN